MDRRVFFRAFPFVVIFLWGFYSSVILRYCFASDGLLKVHFIDVGYGDAILIEFPDSTTMLMDAGEEKTALQFMEYFNSHDIRHIDTAIITHPHKNHFEGFSSILENLPIKRVFINGDNNAEEGYLKLLEDFRGNQIPVKILRAGQELDFLPPLVEMKILHPSDLKGNANANSIVCWLTYQEISFLFMADIEQEQQNDLIAANAKIKAADVIKIPHHGGPLSDQFLEELVDKIFIIPTGPNPWGLPRSIDLQRLKGEVYRTDELGTIILESDGHKIEVKYHAGDN